MDLLLYNQSGCKPKNTESIQFVIPVGLSKTKTVVSAVAGKKIVPMWVCVSNNVMGTSNLKYTMVSGSTTLINNALQTLSSWPIFTKFDGEFISKIGENENLIITCYGSNSDVFTVTLGYYVI